MAKRVLAPRRFLSAQCSSTARAILAELEEGSAAPADRTPAAPADQVSLTDLGALEAAERLRRVDVNTLTPIEAMNLLYELKQKL